jgi:glyoxylate reductase
MTKKILVTGTSVRRELLQPLVDAGYTVENPTHLLSEDELRDALESSAGYLLGGDEFAGRSALVTAKGLKVIAFLGMGYESFVDVAAATEFGIPITNTPGTLSNAVAEFTVGLLLSSTRKLYLYASQFASGRSGAEEKQRDLAAMHVGIVGLGGIGTRIAEILRRGFGCKVSYYSRTRKPEAEEKLGVHYSSLEDIVKEVQAIVIMTSSTPETKGLIEQSLVSSFKPGLILVNTARPDIVDPVALVYGIEGGFIEYAAFDGFYELPSDLDDKLRSFIPTKLMVTGHIASLTHEARDGMAARAISSILNMLNSGTDPYIVNGL